MSQTHKTLKELLVKITFFRDLKRRDFYFKKLGKLKEKDAKELIKILKNVLKNRDRKILEAKKRWDKFIAKKEKEILTSIKNKVAAREKEKIEQIRKKLK